MTQKAAQSVTRRLVQFLPIAPQSLLYGSTPILCDGTQACCTFAGAVGGAFGATVGIGRVELAARSRLMSCAATSEDPRSERVGC